MNTVHNLREILLLVKVGQFEDKALKIVRGGTRARKRGHYLRQTSIIANEIEEIVDVVRMSEIQLPCLIKCC